MKTLEKLAIGGALVLSFFAGCNNIPKSYALVKIPVESESRLWVIKNKTDAEGDKLVNNVSWDKLLYDAYNANGVDNAKDLSKVIQNKGYIMLPREDINRNYNLK